ncbi:peptidase inhibitor family I36 protein [Streptomyces sp. NPDC048483]|uniref:peptidase inhibitor family I36 protein n=1 Tax=Streptomyces sp. NPDC048483 TaxID=3154927 RepID=UPI003441F6B9
MRKIYLKMATAASAVIVAGLIPAASAVAAAPTPTAGSVKDLGCRAESKLKRNGKVYVYATWNCKGRPICVDVDNDRDYAKGGDCKGADNRASSVVNRGWAVKHSDVRFYLNPGYGGRSGCLRDGQYRERLPQASNNKISSHKWTNC